MAADRHRKRASKRSKKKRQEDRSRYKTNEPWYKWAEQERQRQQTEEAKGEEKVPVPPVKKSYSPEEKEAWKETKKEVARGSKRLELMRVQVERGKKLKTPGPEAKKLMDDPVAHHEAGHIKRLGKLNTEREIEIAGTVKRKVKDSGYNAVDLLLMRDVRHKLTKLERDWLQARLDEKGIVSKDIPGVEKGKKASEKTQAWWANFWGSVKSRQIAKEERWERTIRAPLKGTRWGKAIQNIGWKKKEKDAAPAGPGRLSRAYTGVREWRDKRKKIKAEATLAKAAQKDKEAEEMRVAKEAREADILEAKEQKPRDDLIKRARRVKMSDEAYSKLFDASKQRGGPMTAREIRVANREIDILTTAKAQEAIDKQHKDRTPEEKMADKMRMRGPIKRPSFWQKGGRLRSAEAY